MLEMMLQFPTDIDFIWNNRWKSDQTGTDYSSRALRGDRKVTIVKSQSTIGLITISNCIA